MTTDGPFPDARALLRKHGLAAKKSWGQNFLVGESVYRAIVDAVVSTDADWIVEIGAGLGTLTMRLAERVAEGKVIALERDRELVTVLEAELGHLDNVEIHPANALTYDYGQLLRWRGEPVAICGNLPYQIASQILFRLLDARTAWTRAVVMLQKEMADRILAAPDTADYGALGVLLGTYLDGERILRVKPGAFVPPPKVDSTVIRLTPLAAPRAAIGNPDHYARVVHAAFGQRRKTLRNALRAVWPVEEVDAALGTTGLDGGRRGETLAIAEFAALASALPAAASATPS